MNQMSSWINGGTSASMMREDLVAAMARVKPAPRDVFVYPGPMGRFKADLAASGVEMRGAAITRPGIPPVPFGLSPLGGHYLECWEIDGNVWIAGCYRDVEDARDGKLPFQWIRPGP